jgi:hypothetical protein
MERAGEQAPGGLSRNLEAVLKALEREGVEITEDGVRRAGKPHKPRR